MESHVNLEMPQNAEFDMEMCLTWDSVSNALSVVSFDMGFRVEATDLPVAPAVPEVEPLVAPVHEYTLPVAPVFDGKAPEPVQDTPEVAAAKAEHLALLEAATAERRRR